MGFAASEGFQPKYSGEDHWSIRRHFRDYQPDHSEIRGKIFAELGRMYDNRRMADYNVELKRTSPAALADLTIKMAKGILEKLNALRIEEDEN